MYRHAHVYPADGYAISAAGRERTFRGIDNQIQLVKRRKVPANRFLYSIGTFQRQVFAGSGCSRRVTVTTN